MIISLGSASRMKTWTVRVPDPSASFDLFEQRKVFDRHEIQIKHFKPFDPALYHRAGFLGAEKLQQSGHGDVAKSWVGSGQNQPISPGPLSSALGPSIIKALATKTGMSEQELTAQLSQALPGFVDKLTPQGRLPTHEELASFGN